MILAANHGVLTFPVKLTCQRADSTISIDLGACQYANGAFEGAGLESASFAFS